MSEKKDEKKSQEKEDLNKLSNVDKNLVIIGLELLQKKMGKVSKAADDISALDIKNSMKKSHEVIEKLKTKFL